MWFVQIIWAELIGISVTFCSLDSVVKYDPECGCVNRFCDKIKYTHRCRTASGQAMVRYDAECGGLECWQNWMEPKIDILAHLGLGRAKNSYGAF